MRRLVEWRDGMDGLERIKMRDGEPCLRYGEHTIKARQGQRLLDAILEAGIDHRHICGGRGFCTSCRVEVLGGTQGLSPVGQLERQRLGREAGRLRLACQAQIRGTVEVRVPPPRSSRFSPHGD